MIQQIWDNIIQETSKNLVDSIARRLKIFHRIKEEQGVNVD